MEHAATWTELATALGRNRGQVYVLAKRPWFPARELEGWNVDAVAAAIAANVVPKPKRPRDEFGPMIAFWGKSPCPACRSWRTERRGQRRLVQYRRCTACGHRYKVAGLVI